MNLSPSVETWRPQMPHYVRHCVLRSPPEIEQDSPKSKPKPSGDLLECWSSMENTKAPSALPCGRSTPLARTTSKVLRPYWTRRSAPLPTVIFAARERLSRMHLSLGFHPRTASTL